MPDTVILTLVWGTMESDFELPAKQPLTVWMESLKMALKSTFTGIRLEEKKVALVWKGIPIPKEATLEECGIFDGDILEVQVK